MVRSTSRRIRVAHVITGLELGGGGAVVLTIARALDRQRFQMDVFCVYEGGEGQEELQRLGCRVVLLKAWDYRRRVMSYSPRWTMRLASMLRDGQYDVVHTHIFQADVVGRVAARLAGVPVVVKSLHNMGQWKTWRHIAVDRLLLRWTDAVICCSEYQREVARAQERFADMTGVLINNGVDVRRFGRPADPALVRSLRLDPLRPVVGTVGRLIDAKGHEYLMAAVPEVLARYPATQFLLVGDGALRDTLCAALPETARGHVRFAGARADIPELLALMDIFVFPSVTEGFPIAPLEAMAARLPVVASDIRPLRDIVAPDETGILVPPRDPGALAAALIELLEHPQRAVAFGAAGRQRVERYFNDQQMVHSTENLYSSLLQSAGATTARRERALRSREAQGSRASSPHW